MTNMTDQQFVKKNRCSRSATVGLFLLALFCVANAPTMAAEPTGGGQTLPPGHPKLEHAPVSSLTHPKSGSHYKVDIDPKIAAQWKAVKLGLSTKGEKEKIATVPIGGQTRIGTLTIKVVAFAPHWMSNDGMVRSASAKPTNPAVLLAVSGDKKPLEGWVFENLPEFNTFPAQPLKVRLLGGIHIEK